MNERQARRLLDEAEGYLILGAHTESLRRIGSVEGSGLVPVEAARARGEYHRERGEFQEGEEAFLRALALRPGDVAATVGLGWCRKRLGNLPGAIEVYLAALTRNPTEAILFYNLACYLSLHGQTEKSLEMLEQAVRMQPRYAQEARTESDFDPVRGDPRFEVLTSGS